MARRASWGRSKPRTNQQKKRERQRLQATAPIDPNFRGDEMTDAALREMKTRYDEMLARQENDIEDSTYPGNLGGKSHEDARSMTGDVLPPHAGPTAAGKSAAGIGMDPIDPSLGGDVLPAHAAHPASDSPERRAMHQMMLDAEKNHPIPEELLEISLRPADVVHLRNQQIKWWSIKDVWQWRYALQGRRPLPGYEHTPLEGESARIWMENGFRNSDLFWVSPEMTQIITELSPSIPDCIPQPPAKSGFVVFARSIPGTDAESGGIIYSTAFLWQPVTTVAGECWGIETYAWRELIHGWRTMNVHDQLRFNEVMPMRLHPTGGQEWPVDSETSDFSKIPAANPGMEKSMLEDRQVLATFWALCSQKITIEEEWKPDRPMRRQAQRERWAVLPSVRVIRLREATRSTKGTGESREWSHRWLVGAHWRNQWYPSTGQHRPKLIDSYVKGPEDKPLVVRETVRALVR